MNDKPKRNSGLMILMAIVLIGAVISAVTKPDVPHAPPAPPKTAKQIAQELAAEKAAAKRVTLAKLLAMTVKENAREPESVKFESMLVAKNGDVACAEYRARNGFGGMNKEFVVVVGDEVKRDTRTWSKRCVNVAMYNLLFAVQ